MNKGEQGYHKKTSRWEYLVEGKTVYLSEEFGEEVVADTMSPLCVDVEHESCSFKWFLLCWCGVNISVFWIDIALGENLSKIMDLAYRAKTFSSSLGCMVETLIYDPHVREEMEIGPGTFDIFRYFCVCNLFGDLVSAPILIRFLFSRRL